MLTRLRVRLPDRPGFLGRVAALLGRAGVDIRQVTVLERGSRALDDLVLELPPAMLPGALGRMLTEIPGVRVEGCWQTGDSLDLGTDTDVIGEVAAHPARALEIFVDAVPRLLHAHWAAALTRAGGRVAHASWRAPKLTPLPELAVHRTRAFTAGDGSRLAVSPLGTGLAVLVGRRNAAPFHETELARLGKLSDTVGILLATIGPAGATGRQAGLALVAEDS